MESAHPVVMKFGGTSVQDADALGRVIEAVAAEPRGRIVVVSALAGVTDALAELADGKVRGCAGGELIHRLLERHIAIVRELVAPARRPALIERLGDRFEQVARHAGSGTSRKDAWKRDAILAVGELANSQIVSAVFSAAGIPSSWIDARDVIVTDNTFGAARPQHEAIRRSTQRYLAPLVASGRIPVLGGFVGSTPEGATTTLGRGGSDYTAALVAAGVGASEVQIWTDVDGVFTADPRVVDRPSLIPALSFHEAYELARFGARVLHWGTLEPAASDDIPIRVVNTCRRGAAGTAVAARRASIVPTVAGLAHQVGVMVVDVRARGVVGSLPFLQTAMEWLGREGHPATVISLSPTRLVVVSADEAQLDRLVAAVQRVATASVSRNVGLVAVVGDGIGSHAAAWRVVTAARDAGHVGSIVAAQSGDALICITGRHATLRVVAHLHETFFGDGGRTRQRVRAAETNGDRTRSMQAGAGL